jgi:putative transcriptional regulator
MGSELGRAGHPNRLGWMTDRAGITLANLSILKTGKAKAIRFSTLDAICRQLGCQPSDLLAFDADGAPAEEKPATDAP